MDLKLSMTHMSDWDSEIGFRKSCYVLLLFGPNTVAYLIWLLDGMGLLAIVAILFGDSAFDVGYDRGESASIAFLWSNPC